MIPFIIVAVIAVVSIAVYFGRKEDESYSEMNDRYVSDFCREKDKISLAAFDDYWIKKFGVYRKDGNAISTERLNEMIIDHNRVGRVTLTEEEYLFDEDGECVIGEDGWDDKGIHCVSK